MEYMERIVSNERTAANVSGIRLNLETSNLQFKPHLGLFSQLENFAKEAEKLALHNKKEQFMLDLEKMDLDFKEKWNSPDNYENDDSFKTMQEEAKKLESEKTRLLNNNSFFNLEEKEILKKKLEINSQKKYIKRMEIRNEVYSKREIDRTLAITRQWETIGSNVSIYDEERSQEIRENLINNHKALGKLTGDSDEEIMNKTVVALNRMGNSQLTQELENILSSNTSTAVKENKIKNLESLINNEKYREALTNDLMKQIGSTDERVRDFVRSGIDEGRDKILKNYRKEFEQIKKAEARELQAYRREQETLKKLNSYFNVNSTEYDKRNALFKKVHNRDMTNEDIAKSYKDYNWDKVGNSTDTDKVQIFNAKEIKLLKENLDYALNANSITENEYNLEIVKKADELASLVQDEAKSTLARNAFLKQYAQMYNKNPIPLIYGHLNPKLYEVDNNIKKSKGKIFEKLPIPKEDGRFNSSKSMIDAIAAQLSDDPKIGRQRAEHMVNTYVYNKGALVRVRGSYERVPFNNLNEYHDYIANNLDNELMFFEGEDGKEYIKTYRILRERNIDFLNIEKTQDNEIQEVELGGE